MGLVMALIQAFHFLSAGGQLLVTDGQYYYFELNFFLRKLSS